MHQILEIVFINMYPGDSSSISRKNDGFFETLEEPNILSILNAFYP